MRAINVIQNEIFVGESGSPNGKWLYLHVRKETVESGHYERAYFIPRPPLADIEIAATVEMILVSERIETVEELTERFCKICRVVTG